MLCAGIDVSKPHLDLALASGTAKPTRLRFPNTPEGRQALLAALAHLRPTWVALEPTGAYHLPSSSSWQRRASRWPWSTPTTWPPSAGPRESATRPTAKTPSSSPTTPGSTGKASGPTPYPRKPSGSSGPWWATGRIWPGGSGPSSTRWRRRNGRGARGSSPSSRGSWPA